MVWDQLTDHLDVIWGALLALVIVIALTPAVGGMALSSCPGASRSSLAPHLQVTPTMKTTDPSIKQFARAAFPAKATSADRFSERG